MTIEPRSLWPWMLLAGLLPGRMALAQEGPVLETEFKLNVETFATFSNVQEGSPFNPQNLLGDFPQEQLEVQLRPFGALYYGDVSASVSPRYSIRQDLRDGRGDRDEEAWLQDWALQIVRPNWSASYTRELLFWGPSVLAAPSNPFYASNNQTNPFVEPGARDFLQAQYFPDPYKSVALIANIDQGRGEALYPRFEPIYALKGDWVGETHSATALVASRDGEPQLGLTLQWTASDALLLYGDLGLRWHNEGLYPRENPDGSFSLAPADDPDRPLMDVLAGLSFTFDDGSTTNLELRYNQAGYDDREAERFNRAAAVSTELLFANDPNTPQAIAFLARSADPFLRTLRQRYLYAQYFKRDVVPDLSVNLLLQYNLDDHSSQALVIANYYLSDNWRLAGNFIVNFGDEDSEFGRYFENISFIGLKYFFD